MMQFDASSDRKRMGYFMMVLFGIIGAILVLLSFSIKSPASLLLILIVGLVFIGAGRLIYLDSNRLSLTIDEYSITLQQAFSFRSFLLADIKGYRIDESGRAVKFLLVTQRDTIAFAVPPGLERRYELLAWLKDRYPELDALSYAASTENMLEDQRFAATRVERLVTLSRAILTSVIARALAILLILLDTVLVLPVNLPFMVIVFLLPWAVIACVVYFKGMLRLYRGKGDANPAAGMLLWVGSAVIVVNTLANFQLYAFNARGVVLVIALAAAIGVIWFYGCKQVVMPDVRKRWLMPGIFAAALAYSSGLLIYTNCYHDGSVAEIRRVEIDSKDVHYGRYGRSYRLRLYPWTNDFTTKTVTVPYAYFKKVRIGDSVTVHIGQGRWDIPWYRIEY